MLGQGRQVVELENVGHSVVTLWAFEENGVGSGQVGHVGDGQGRSEGIAQQLSHGSGNGQVSNIAVEYL